MKAPSRDNWGPTTSRPVLDLDGLPIRAVDVDRMHQLLDMLGAPARDDHGQLLTVRWRLIALTAEKGER